MLRILQKLASDSNVTFESLRPKPENLDEREAWIYECEEKIQKAISCFGEWKEETKASITKEKEIWTLHYVKEKLKLDKEKKEWEEEKLALMKAKTGLALQERELLQEKSELHKEQVQLQMEKSELQKEKADLEKKGNLHKRVDRLNQQIETQQKMLLTVPVMKQYEYYDKRKQELLEAFEDACEEKKLGDLMLQRWGCKKGRTSDQNLPSDLYV